MNIADRDAPAMPEKRTRCNCQKHGNAELSRSCASLKKPLGGRRLWVLKPTHATGGQKELNVRTARCAWMHGIEYARGIPREGFYIHKDVLV